MPNQLVAFREIPICHAVVCKKKIKKLKKWIASFPEKAKDAEGVRQQDPEEDAVQLNNHLIFQFQSLL